MSRKRKYTKREIDRVRKERRSPMRSNPKLSSLASDYHKQGYDPVDSVRRAVEDLFPVLPGQTLVFPGVGVWKMGEERLSHKISDNLRSLRAVPGRMSGKDVPYSEEDEEESLL